MPDASEAALRADWYLRGRLRLRHLRLLMVMDDVRNVGEAARRMATTQPAVSRMLAELEEMVGARLFERTSKGTFPTVHGASMIRHASWVLGDLERMGREWSEPGGLGVETLSVGINSSSAAFLVPRTLLRLFTAYRLRGAWQKLTLGGGANWQSRVYYDGVGPNGERQEQGAYAVASLMARYDFTPALSLQLNVNNVFDKTYQRAVNWYGQGVWGTPREFMATLRYRF